MVVPGYVLTFRCKANLCTDHCCKNWEIWLDDDTAYRYRHTEGKLGEKLRSVMKVSEGGSYFELREDGNCPFLKEDGLCELQCEKGESFLSEICQNHPRFYLTIDHHVEMGVGMCCEEAARRILDKESSTKLYHFDSKNVYLPKKSALTKNRIYEMQNVKSTLEAFLASSQYQKATYYEHFLIDLLKEEALTIDYPIWLTDMKEHLTSYLSQKEAFLKEVPDAKFYLSRILEYMIFRYKTTRFGSAAFKEWHYIFQILSLIFLLDLRTFTLTKSFDAETQIEITKRVSQELEYDDEMKQKLGSSHWMKAYFLLQNRKRETKNDDNKEI